MKLFPTKRQWYRSPFLKQLILIGTWGSIIVLVLGIVIFTVPYLFNPNPTDREYLVRLITVAESDNTLLLQQARQLIEPAILNNRNPKVRDNKAGNIRDDSTILKKMHKDNNVFALLSEPFRRRFPTFIRLKEVYLSVLDSKRPDLEHKGALRLLLLELEAQHEFLSLEKAYQLGTIGKKEHQNKFDALMNRKAMQLISLVAEVGERSQ